MPKISSANKTEIIEEETQVKDSVTLQQIHLAVESLRKETDTLFVRVGRRINALENRLSLRKHRRESRLRFQGEEIQGDEEDDYEDGVSTDAYGFSSPESEQ